MPVFDWRDRHYTLVDWFTGIPVQPAIPDIKNIMRRWRRSVIEFVPAENSMRGRGLQPGLIHWYQK